MSSNRRLGQARANGYEVHFRKIDPEITPYNRVLLGYPPL